MRYGTPDKRPKAQRTRPAVPTQPHSTTPPRPAQPPGLTDESQIAFDVTDGHRHDGSDSHTVDYSNLTGRGHVLATATGLGVDHTVSGLTTGHVLTATGPTTAAFQAPAAASSHNLLSATHPDTTAGTVAQGDLVVGQGSTPTWARLALGLSGRYLRSDGTDAVWAQIPYTDLAYSGLTTGHVLKATGAGAAGFGQLLHSQLGSIGANDHHNQAHALFSGSDHSDVTGTPASGDLIYRNGSSRWAPLPKGTDGQILKQASGLPSWANVNSVATTRALIQGWKRDDIRNASTSADEMNGFDGLKTGETMAYSGSLVGIAVALEKDIDNSGDAPSASYTLTAYKSSDQGATWSATAVTVTLSAGAGTQRRAYAAGFSAAFAAGDMLTIYDQKANLPAITNGCKANLIVVFD